MNAMKQPPNELIKRESELIHREAEAIKREELQVKKIRDTYAQKYPLLFTLGGALGLVATFYGFEKLIDKYNLFANNPWLLMGMGLLLLAITGSFYNKLR